MANIKTTGVVVEGSVTVSRQLLEELVQHTLSGLLWADEALRATGRSTPAAQTKEDGYRLTYAALTLVTARQYLSERSRQAVDRTLSTLTGQPIAEVVERMGALAEGNRGHSP